VSVEKMRDFRWQIKISHFARLFQILTDVYGISENMGKLRNMEGMVVNAAFPKMNQQYASIRISNCHFYPQEGKAEHAVATIIFNLEANQIVPTINDVIRTNANLLGLTKLTFKYLLPGKIGIRGSLFKAICFIMSIMLGKHPMYQAEKHLKPGEVVYQQ
jgi:hypothetical protein